MSVDQEQTGLAVPDGRAVMLHVYSGFFGFVTLIVTCVAVLPVAMTITFPCTKFAKLPGIIDVPEEPYRSHRAYLPGSAGRVCPEKCPVENRLGQQTEQR
jgi:hypothetical protein